MGTPSHITRRYVGLLLTGKSPTLSYYDSLPDASGTAPSAITQVMSVALCQCLEGSPNLPPLPKVQAGARYRVPPSRGAKQGSMPALKPKHTLKLRVVRPVRQSPPDSVGGVAAMYTGVTGSYWRAQDQLPITTWACR